MWMVVSEDSSGRLRYQCHNLPPPAAQPPPAPSNPSNGSATSIYSSSSPSDHHMQRFTRGGCLSFPDPMGGSPRNTVRSHTLPSGHGGYYHEMEQYDNVNDYSSYGGPDSSSSTTSSAEYQDPVYSTRCGSSGTYARRQNYARCYVPISADAFYYYHQQHQHPHAYRPRQRSHDQIHSHYRAPSPDPDYSPPMSRNKVRFQLPEEPVSRGEYVSNNRRNTKVFNTEDFIDEEKDYEAVSMNPNPAPHQDSVLVHRSNGQVSVMVNKKAEPIYCSGGSDSAESSSAAPSSVEADTPPPIPAHPPARHRLVKKSPKEIRGTHQNGIGATPTRPFEITQAYGGTIRGPPMTIGGGQGITPMGTMAAAPNSRTQSDATSSGSSWFKNKSKKKDKKLKIKKEDISNPTNFQHKAHVGWNQDSGFSNTVYDDDMDEATKNILKAAGLESNNLNEADKKFVKRFIADNYDKYVSVGNLDPSQISAPMPPPVQQQQPIQSWNQTPARQYKPSFPASAPVSVSYAASPVAPPPPTRVESHGIAPARPPPPPPTNRGYAPSRPLPQAPYGVSLDTRPHAVPPPPPPPPPAPAPATVSASAPPPPPPPPPMPIGGLSSVGVGAPPPPPPPPPFGGPSTVLASLPPAQNGRSDLLAEIQAGKQLRSVQQSSTDSPKSGDARGDVMAQIRQGAQLKHVDAAAEQERRKSTTAGVAGMGGLAGALAQALEARRMNMGIEDSSDDDEDDDEKNEWSD